MSMLKLIGVLMDYPQDEMWEHRDELLQAADAPELTPRRRKALAAFTMSHFGFPMPTTTRGPSISIG